MNDDKVLQSRIMRLNIRLNRKAETQETQFSNRALQFQKALWTATGLFAVIALALNANERISDLVWNLAIEFGGAALMFALINLLWDDLNSDHRQLQERIQNVGRVAQRHTLLLRLRREIAAAEKDGEHISAERRILLETWSKELEFEYLETLAELELSEDEMRSWLRGENF